jgi:2-methylcitrate dehydratase PrpD
MEDATVRRHRAKVKYVPDEELARLLPVRVAVVEITLKDGSRISDRVEAVRGTVRNPMTRDEVVEKARDLMAPVLGRDQTQRLIGAVLSLDTAPDLRSLRSLLQRRV